MSDGILTSPTVSFSRNGQELVLGRSNEDILHLYGSTGLGLPPVQIASSERIGGDGSMLRGVRYASRETFIPIAILKRTRKEATEARRQLYRLLAPHLGPVTIRVQDIATGSDRSIEGILKEGLEGDFGDTFHGHYQTLGLTFECLEPWWKGEEKVIELNLNPGTKPFISKTVPFFPVTLARSSAQGTFDIEIAGDDYVAPVWEFIGEGTDPTISNGKDNFVINTVLKPGQKVTMNMATGRMSPDLWQSVPLSSKPFKLAPGKNTIRATMVQASITSVIRATYRERFLEAL